jgi:hypothetical protein
MPPDQSTCSTCGAALIWAVTVAGRRIPLDAEPEPYGMYGLVDGKAVSLAGSMMTPAFAGSRHRSHFETCPQASSHGRGRAGKARKPTAGLFGDSTPLPDQNLPD